ncbi:helix-turn-helix domain-containing protein [Mesorhizobium sp. RP14(2022)]|uniref:Helix-turn-helix domain-containing protein n=1 Tax=Mesorhizobium liriopis TaxID=2953882 RepID=A0ABT1C3J5_9HYPH|nr:helix-turn-helix transcriptional regulator [Mesorhizobium liriopis]MCO6049357.1 helix-turn-helix domain-containing protein [Mesorhizobium liriopis]
MNGRALVAWNLRRLRVARGISQERLAADAEVDRAYLGGLERQTENPTVDLLDRIAGVLAVTVTDLFEKPRAGDQPPETLKRGRKPR